MAGFSLTKGRHKMRTYCLYDALNAEAIRMAARRSSLPPVVVIELEGEIWPEMFASCSPSTDNQDQWTPVATPT